MPQQNGENNWVSALFEIGVPAMFMLSGLCGGFMIAFHSKSWNRYEFRFEKTNLGDGERFVVALVYGAVALFGLVGVVAGIGHITK